MARPTLRVEELGTFSLESQTVIGSFIARFPEMGSGFAARAAIDLQSWNAALAAEHPLEAQPEPRTLKDGASESDRRLFEIGKRLEEERFAKKESAPLTKPLKEAMRLAKREALATGRETYTLGQLVSAVLRTESNAATVLASLADEAKLPEAFRWLDAQPDPAEGDFVADRMANTKALVAKMWPSIREQSYAKFDRSKFNSQREELYAKNPDRYEMPLNLSDAMKRPIPDGHLGFHARSGLFLHAAANEARIRHAPEVTFNHMFYVLLQDGTETSQFLDQHGVDREEWRQAVDEVLPRFEEGPRWPENARDLGMNMPSAGDKVITKKPMPEDLDFSTMTKDQRGEYIEVIRGNKPFVDLAWLLIVFKEEETVGFGLMAEAGITADSVKAELTLRQTGDRDWYLKRPNIVEAIRDRKGDTVGARFHEQSAIEDGAIFEARLRWAPEVELGHVLLALLVDGTDTSEYLDSLGINRNKLWTQIDAGLPRHSAGPYFPRVSKDVRHYLMLMYLGVERGTSDLKYVECLLNSEPRPIGRGPNPLSEILTEFGLSLDAVRQRLRELGVEFRSDGSERT
jgi:hypothetical protein